MKRFPSAIIVLIFIAALCNFMKKKCQIITMSILLLFFSLLLINVALAQERPLEAEYPEIQGFKPETVAANLPQYVKYIFNFAIAIVGLIAFGVLVWAGIRYLTSVGNPKETAESKKQILAVILGLLILLFSYLILTTINPQLVIFRLPGLTPAPVTPATTTPPILEPTPDVYEKIKLLVNALSDAVKSIDSQVSTLKNLIEQCNCSNAKSMCICGSGSGSSYSLDYCGSCKGLYCYNAPGAHICKDETQIKAGQQTILSLRDEILYHKNRFLAEKEDLLLEIGQLEAEIEYYTKKIEAENKVLQQLQDENAKKLQQDIISAYEDKKKETEKEKFIKEELIKHFDELAKPNGLIDQMADEIPKTSGQIDKCFLEGVKECSASCSGGCHDTLGCKPDDCSGGTPSVCSIDNYSTIQNIKSKIDNEIQAILDILQKVTEPTPPAPGSCETSGGVCVGTGESCPSNYEEANQYACKETDKKCCMSTEVAVCQCSQSPYKGCVNLQTYGISYKDGAYTDKRLAEKLVKFKDCLARNGISAWRVTEACPPTVTHQSSCHSGNGKCVDADSGVLCKNQSAVESCIRETGFSSFLNECKNINGPHFHINF